MFKPLSFDKLRKCFSIHCAYFSHLVRLYVVFLDKCAIVGKKSTAAFKRFAGDLLILRNVSLRHNFDLIGSESEDSV